VRDVAFQIQTIESAPAGSKAPLDKLHRTFGMVPNIAGVIANSPILANIFVDLFHGVHGGTLNRSREPDVASDQRGHQRLHAVAFRSFLAAKQGLEPTDGSADAARLKIRVTPLVPSSRGILLRAEAT
jgi:hypothetical protein